MKINILNEVPHLINAGIITQEAGEKILEYYKTNEKDKTHPLLLVFGILGSVLSGLGLILIIAHNWNQLSIMSKTTIAFTPLLISQILCGYTLLKKPDNKIWKETTATLLFFTVGASIAQISQIYHIMGEISSYLLTWSLLCIPLIYIMRSSMVSILSIVLITAYGVSHLKMDSDQEINYIYGLLILTIVPHYLSIIKEQTHLGFTVLHHWLLPLSISTMFLTFVNDKTGVLYTLVYMSLMGLFYIIGNILCNDKIGFLRSGFKPISVIFSLTILFFMSSEAAWNEIVANNSFINLRDNLMALVIMGIAIVLFIRQYGPKNLAKTNPFNYIFLLYFVLVWVGYYLDIGFYLMNILTLSLGIWSVYLGIDKTNLKLMNLGLFIVSLWVLIKFFSSDYSFLSRGLVFIGLGIGFYLANYQIMNKPKLNENE